MKVEINLNDSVRVKLTERGLKIYKEYFKQFPIDCHREPKIVDSYYETQLHELMQIFGSSLFNGCIMPFETANIIVINQD